MPKVAIFFVLLLGISITSSYAYTTGDMIPNEVNPDKIQFDSGIVDVDSIFFSENNFKRYLIFGSNQQDSSFIQSNSIYGINSDHGFFYVATLSEKNATNLISQGYHVVEDFQLDFHSKNDNILDASRIPQITGSDIAAQKLWCNW